MVENGENNENTAIFLYFTGHGVMDERTRIVLNDDSKKDVYAYPLESALRTLSDSPSVFIVAVFDSCRYRQKNVNVRTLIEDREEE